MTTIYHYLWEIFVRYAPKCYKWHYIYCVGLDPSNVILLQFHYFCAITEYSKNFLRAKSYQNMLQIATSPGSMPPNPHSGGMATFYHNFF